MTLIVSEAAAEALPLLRRLLEFNAYEFSAIDGRDLNADGEFGYPYLDLYDGASSERVARLFRVDGRIAGFALIRLGAPHQVAEFLVLPKYRRRGLGTEAARQVLSGWAGEWITHQVAGNQAALEFWRRVIPVPFTETSDESGTTQRFVITHAHPGSAPAHGPGADAPTP